MTQIRRDAGSSDDIVAGELVNLGTELAKHGKRLADATSGTKDGYLGRGGGGGGEGPGGGGLGGGGGGHLPEGGSGGRSRGKHIVLIGNLLETRRVIGYIWIEREARVSCGPAQVKVMNDENAEPK